MPQQSPKFDESTDLRGTASIRSAVSRYFVICTTSGSNCRLLARRAYDVHRRTLVVVFVLLVRANVVPFGRLMDFKLAFEKERL